MLRRSARRSRTSVYGEALQPYTASNGLKSPTKQGQQPRSPTPHLSCSALFTTLATPPADTSTAPHPFHCHAASPPRTSVDLPPPLLHKTCAAPRPPSTIHTEPMTPPPPTCDGPARHACGDVLPQRPVAIRVVQTHTTVLGGEGGGGETWGGGGEV